MPGKTIVIEYNGKRFPRAVSLRGGQKLNFHENRTTLELDEYDAMLLLKYNTRITPEKFEFSVSAVIGEDTEVLEHDNAGDENEDEGSQEQEQKQEETQESEEDKPKSKVLKINKRRK